MASSASLIGVCWITFLVTWVVTAVVYRPTSAEVQPPGHGRAWRRSVRLVLALVIILGLRSTRLSHESFGHGVAWLGVAVCAAGIGVAIWARICLGRSWGMPMTLRAEPVLVSRGPYHAIRHPIYSGILFALLGTALATGVAALAAFAGACVYFVLSMRVEEADMASLFPEQYPAYAGHTKRLIPFVY